MSVLRPVALSLDGLLSFEIRKCEFSKFILFRDSFGYSWALSFPYELWVFPFLQKQESRGFGRGCAASIDQCGEYHGNNIKSSNPSMLGLSIYLSLL